MVDQEKKSLTPVRILVVDDQQLVREGIASLLHVQEGLSVIGTALNGQDALEQAIAQDPDVILMDVRMPVMDGVEATRKILRQLPSCCILMLTTFDDDEYVRDALRAGARGYLLKDIPAQQLARAVHAVSQGVYQFDETVMNHLIKAFNNPSTTLHSGNAEQGATILSHLPHSASNLSSQQPTTSALTRREREILRLVADGATNREIAEHLTISEGTVKNHLSNLFSRLGLRDRTQAVMYARERGLI